MGTIDDARRGFFVIPIPNATITCAGAASWHQLLLAETNSDCDMIWISNDIFTALCTMIHSIPLTEVYLNYH